MPLDFRVHTIPTECSAPNCGVCQEVLDEARKAGAPYILEWQDAELPESAAWGYGHLAVGMFREIEERVLSWDDYFLLKRCLESELTARGL